MGTTRSLYKKFVCKNLIMEGVGFQKLSLLYGPMLNVVTT